MAELMAAAPPASEPSVDPELSMATEMAERAARSVAEEPATLAGPIEVRARPAALWQRITAFIVDGALVGG
ncbi:MAG TPA: RDD family protein, partial [Myxococcaceae bacterium]